MRRDRTREEPAAELVSSFTSSLAMRASCSCVHSAQRSKGPSIPSKGDGGPYEAISGLAKAALFLRLGSGTGGAAEAAFGGCGASGSGATSMPRIEN